MQVKFKSNVKQFLREIDRVDQERVKIAKIAVRVELFRLSTLFRQDVKSGKAGGKAHKPLTAIAWWSKRSKQQWNPAPLQRLYPFVGYDLQSGPQGVQAEMGFVGHRVTAHWRNIILKQQQGFTQPVSALKRRFFIRKGGYLSGRGRTAEGLEAKFFFLRKSTTTMKTPSRDIVETFWRANHDRAWRNIKSNYVRKMAGERI